VILAVPSTRVSSLLPASCRGSFHLREISSAAVSPILCIHLWYEHPVSPHAVLGVLGRRVQWVFRHPRLHSSDETEGETRGCTTRGTKGIAQRDARGERLSLVISAASEESAWTNKALIDVATEDCGAIFGEAAQSPYHALVIREKRATFSLSPSVEALRPGTRTPVPNLLLAGDWTATGLPATVEGAIRSGEAAAKCVAPGVSQ